MPEARSMKQEERGFVTGSSGIWMNHGLPLPRTPVPALLASSPCFLPYLSCLLFLASGFLLLLASLAIFSWFFYESTLRSSHATHLPSHHSPSRSGLHLDYRLSMRF